MAKLMGVSCRLGFFDLCLCVQHLSLATSLAKLVDLEQVLGQQDAAAEQAQEVQQILQALKQSCKLSDAANVKVARLESIIAVAANLPSHGSSVTI